MHLRLLELGVHSVISDMPLIALEVRQNFFVDKLESKLIHLEDLSIAQSTTTASTVTNETLSEALSIPNLMSGKQDHMPSIDL